MRPHNAKIILVVGIIATLMSPVLLTQDSCLGIFDFTETGQIGDTIGGITAPIVGLVSIILLYITLKEQQGFNSQQVIDNRVNHLLAIQNDLNALSDRTAYKYKLDGREVYGKGLVDLVKLSQTNSPFVFDYLELNGLFRSCVLARVMCGQIKEFSTDIGDIANHSFNKFIYCYLSSIYKFLNSINHKNVSGNHLDTCYDEEFGSEINRLLSEISEEVAPLNQELKHYKS